MPQIKGPAIFLAQFLADAAPYNNLPNITEWVKSLGYKGVQIPSWDARVIDIKKLTESKAYCDDIQGSNQRTRYYRALRPHLQGQLIAVHPAYDELFDGFAALTRSSRRPQSAHQMGHPADAVCHQSLA